MAEFPPQGSQLQRLFLALWPAELERVQLHGYFPLLEGCGGRKVPLENLHITLAFLGSVDANTRACLEQQLDAVKASSFTLQMDEVGFWRRPQVVWLGASQVPLALSALVNEVQKAMVNCGLEPESRPFQAHLTLMRKAKRVPLEMNPPPMLWRINDFALIASETLPEGAHYEVLRRWPLTGRE